MSDEPFSHNEAQLILAQSSILSAESSNMVRIICPSYRIIKEIILFAVVLEIYKKHIIQQD